MIKAVLSPSGSKETLKTLNSNSKSAASTANFAGTAISSQVKLQDQKSKHTNSGMLLIHS